MVVGRLREAAEVHEARLDRRGRAMVGAGRVGREALAARPATLGFVLNACFHMASCEVAVPGAGGGPHSLVLPGLLAPSDGRRSDAHRGRAASARRARAAPRPGARRWRRCHVRAVDGRSTVWSRLELRGLSHETIGNACGLLLGGGQSSVKSVLTRLGQRPSAGHRTPVWQGPIHRAPTVQPGCTVRSRTLGRDASFGGTTAPPSPARRPDASPEQDEGERFHHAPVGRDPAGACRCGRAFVVRPPRRA